MSNHGSASISSFRSLFARHLQEIDEESDSHLTATDDSEGESALTIKSALTTSTMLRITRTSAAQDDNMFLESGFDVFIRLMSLHTKIFECEDRDALCILYQELSDKSREVKKRLKSNKDYEIAVKGFSREHTHCIQLKKRTDARSYNLADLDIPHIDPQAPEADVMLTWQLKHRHTHLQMLSDVWTDEGFVPHLVEILYRVGPSEAKTLLMSLCVRVPREALGRRKFQFTCPSCPVRLVRGTLTEDMVGPAASLSRMARYHRDMHFLDGLVDEDPQRPGSAWFQKPQRCTAGVFYSTVPNVLDPDATDHTDLFECTQVIAYSSGEFDYHYATPFGQALSAHVWELACPYAVKSFCVDVLLVALLFTLEEYHCDRRRIAESKEALGLGHWKLKILAALFSFLVLHQFLPSVLAIYLLIADPNLTWVRRNHGNLGRLFGVAADVFCVYVATILVSDTVGSYEICTDQTTLEKYMFCIMLLLKMLQIMYGSLRFHWFQNSLPVFYALVSSQSVNLMAFVVFVVLGASAAYSVLPTSTTAERFDLMEWFFRVFRMLFLGDFDLSAEEGSPPAIVEADRSGNATGKHDPVYLIESGSAPDTTLHYLFESFTMIFGLLVPLVLLNMYIGVLSDAFNNAKTHLLHLQGSDMTRRGCRFLLPVLALRKIFRRCGWGDTHRSIVGFLEFITRIEGSTWCSGARTDVDPKGTFIVIPESRLGAGALEELQTTSESSVARFRLGVFEQMAEKRLGAVERMLEGRLGDITDRLDRLESSRAPRPRVAPGPAPATR